MANEEILAFLFAGMLISGTLIVLLSPVIFKLTQETTKWRLYGLLALVLGIMGVSLYVVWLALTNELFFIPFVVLVVGLKGASPTFLFRSLRDRFELTKLWSVLRVILAAGFLGYAGYMAFTIVIDALGPVFGVEQSRIAILSEQLLMAAGGAFLIVRLLARILPESLREKPVVWVSAILISVAFAVLAPYAFPGEAISYATIYRLAGMGGWLLGFVVIWRFS